MSNKTVYLAGPIGGCNKGEANSWRDDVTARIAEHNIIGISPLRCEPLITGRYKKSGYDDPCFGTADAIGSKNEIDVRSCDLTLAYLPTLSPGTLAEIGLAKGAQKPIIVVTKLPLIRKHPLFINWTNWMLDDLAQAVDVIIGVFEDYAVPLPETKREPEGPLDKSV